MERVYLDTESCGFIGPTILIQYSFGISDDVHLWHIWDHTGNETCFLIERIMKNLVIILTVFTTSVIINLLILGWILWS